MKGYKATDKDMQCLNFQYEMGQEYVMNGKIELCNQGFHFCENPFDCFIFYADKGTRLFEVECEDVSNEIHHDCTKRVCSRIKFVKEIIIGEQDEEFHLNMIDVYVYTLQLIPNPSIKVQLAAVNKSGLALEYIKNPSDEVQLAAVNQNGFAITHINNPSLELQFNAIKQNVHAIKYIDNPAVEVQLAAVQLDNKAIRSIINPSPAVIEYINSLM